MGKAFLYGQSGGGSPLKIPEYTGDHVIYGTPKKGYMLLLSSGILTAQAAAHELVDVFMAGAGQGGPAGGGGSSPMTGLQGGNGGETTNAYGVALIAGTTVPVTIGAGVLGGEGGSTHFGSLYALGGAAGRGSGGGAAAWGADSSRGFVDAGDGGEDGQNGGAGVVVPGTGSTPSATYGKAGQGRSTKPFEGDAAPFDEMYYCGGAGGSGARGNQTSGQGGKGGRGGGADGVSYSQGGISGVPNTGGGGSPGGKYYSGSGTTAGSNGGSGICIIRWGDWSTGMEA